MHLILGFGATGVSYLRYLNKKNIPSFIVDSRKNPPGLLEFKSLKEKDLFLGKFNPEVLNQVEMILVSPGVDYRNEILVSAREKGIEIVTDIEIFTKESKSTKLLITGTNGKTSVVKMLGHVLNEIYQNKKVVCCGNIGTPVLDTLSEKQDISVIEVSSFHLEHSNDLKSDVGVLLNVEQDHLDRHLSFETYKKIKERILLNSRAGLATKEVLRSIGCEYEGERLFGILPKGGMAFNFEDVTNPFVRDIYKFFLELDNWPLHEIDNIKSVLSVVLVLETLKGEEEITGIFLEELVSKCLESLISFKRLRHRYEVLGLRKGMTYINDSKSTNISSLLTAINSTERKYGKNKVVLICGGDSKGQDFSKIENSSLESVKKILIFGKDKENIFKDIGDKADCLQVIDLEDAVNKSRTFGTKGDVVLLSPSCASTDMFLDYRERGDKFRELSGFN